MKTTRAFGLIVSVLLVGVVGAQTTRTVRQTIDYTSNTWSDGPWFVEPDVILDHSPYYRGALEDWGWTHNLSTLVPADANAIQSATLTVIAWNVDPNEMCTHVVYVTPTKQAPDTILKTGTCLGALKNYVVANTTVPWSATGQRGYYYTLWSTTTFNLPPSVLDALWTGRQLYFWMDIDQIKTLEGGFRVTALNATLTVKYSATGELPPPVPIYRFWSPVLPGMPHFYTIKEGEKQKLIDNYPDAWTYEGIAYRALAQEGDPNALPVYRFWSDQNLCHLYTISELRKNQIISEEPDVWTYEGPVFYAYPVGQQPEGTVPVHVFWSDVLGNHFYTADEAEKEMLSTYYPDVWTYMGVAWYAYPPEAPPAP